MLSLSLCLLACSLVALSGCGTKPPEPEPQCPKPQIPAELLRKAPKAEPLTSSTQGSVRTLSWRITSDTPSSAATWPTSWTL